jgi:hypothetical protein
MHRSEDIPARHLGDITAVVIGSKNDTITGRIELPPGQSLQPGKGMLLTLHDGNKIKVITEADGRVTATGGLFR